MTKFWEKKIVESFQRKFNKQNNYEFRKRTNKLGIQISENKVTE